MLGGARGGALGRSRKVDGAGGDGAGGGAGCGAIWGSPLVGRGLAAGASSWSGEMESLVRRAATASTLPCWAARIWVAFLFTWAASLAAREVFWPGDPPPRWLGMPPISAEAMSRNSITLAMSSLSSPFSRSLAIAGVSAAAYGAAAFLKASLAVPDLGV